MPTKTKTETEPDFEARNVPAPPKRQEMIGRYVRRAKELWSLQLSRARGLTYTLPSFDNLPVEAEAYRVEFNQLDHDVREQRAKAKELIEDLEHYKRVVRRQEIRKAREQGVEPPPDRQAEFVQSITDANSIADEYVAMQREQGRNVEVYLEAIPAAAQALDARHKAKLEKQLAALRRVHAVVTEPEFTEDEAKLSWARSGVPGQIQARPSAFANALAETIKLGEVELAREWAPEVGSIPPG